MATTAKPASPRPRAVEVSVYITREIAHRLRSAAAASGDTVSSYVRRIIARETRPTPPS